MKEKVYLSVPKDTLSRIILSGVIAEQISGRSTTREEILSALESKGIKITDEVKTKINEALPNIDLS